MTTQTTNIRMLNTPLTRQLTGRQLQEQGIKLTSQRRRNTHAEAPVRFIPRQPANELPDLIA